MTDMAVIEMGEGGGPEVLLPGRRPIPSPGPGEVLIKVTATAVNGPDIAQRKGLYPAPKGASDLLGLEVSGEVVGLGKETSRWHIGDRVCGLTNGGAYAEYVAVDETHCLTIPDGVSERDAGGLCEVYFTVWSNIFHGHTAPRGGIFLVHGGGGGIGSTAIQMGRAMGLRVFTTEGSDEGLAFCQELGAERAIDYRSEDFVEIVREAGGAEIILDIIGRDYIARNIKAARHDARIVQIAFNAGSKVEINLMPVMLKRLIYTGSTLRTRPSAFKAAVARELETQIWPLFAEGKLKPVTHTILPLAEASTGHEMMEAAQHRGKILLAP